MVKLEQLMKFISPVGPTTKTINGQMYRLYRTKRGISLIYHEWEPHQVDDIYIPVIKKNITNYDMLFLDKKLQHKWLFSSDDRTYYYKGEMLSGKDSKENLTIWKKIL